MNLTEAEGSSLSIVTLIPLLTFSDSPLSVISDLTYSNLNEGNSVIV